VEGSKWAVERFAEGFFILVSFLELSVVFLEVG